MGAGLSCFQRSRYKSGNNENNAADKHRQNQYEEVDDHFTIVTKTSENYANIDDDIASYSQNNSVCKQVGKSDGVMYENFSSLQIEKHENSYRNQTPSKQNGEDALNSPNQKELKNCLVHSNINSNHSHHYESDVSNKDMNSHNRTQNETCKNKNEDFEEENVYQNFIVNNKPATITDNELQPRKDLIKIANTRNINSKPNHNNTILNPENNQANNRNVTSPAKLNNSDVTSPAKLNQNRKETEHAKYSPTGFPPKLVPKKKTFIPPLKQDRRQEIVTEPSSGENVTYAQCVKSDGLSESKSVNQLESTTEKSNTPVPPALPSKPKKTKSQEKRQLNYIEVEFAAQNKQASQTQASKKPAAPTTYSDVLLEGGRLLLIK